MTKTWQILLLAVFASFNSIAWGKPVKVITNQATTLIYPAYWHTPFGLHRGTQEQLAYFTNNRARFDHPQGMTCMPLLQSFGTGTSENAYQITVLGVNQGQANVIYNPSLSRLALLSAGPDVPLQKPLDICAAPDGTVWLSDPQAGSVWTYRPDHGQLRWQSKLTSPEGTSWHPSGLACDTQSGCYVSDPVTQCLAYYNAAHQYIKTIGPVLSPEVRLEKPLAIAVTSANEPWSFHKQPFLLILDQEGQRLIKSTLDGVPQQVVWTQSVGSSQTAWAWMALDYYDNVWLTSPQEDRIYKLNRNLQLLDVFGRSGDGDYRFIHPTGIALNRHFGQVFIAEKNSVHYFWIGTDIKQAAAALQPDKHTVLLSFFLTEPALVSLRTREDNHETVIYNKYLLDSGPQQLSWKLSRPLFNKNPVIINLQAEATYSTREHFAKEVTITLDP